MMKMYLRFLFIWAFNSLMIILAHSYYGGSYVLGNAVMTPTTAGILSGFLLTVFCLGAKPVLKMLIAKQGRVIMFGGYWLINFIGLWILARLSFVSGFGIAAFYYAFTLGVFTALGQWLLRQAFKVTKLQ